MESVVAMGRVQDGGDRVMELEISEGIYGRAWTVKGDSGFVGTIFFETWVTSKPFHASLGPIHKSCDTKAEAVEWIRKKLDGYEVGGY